MDIESRLNTGKWVAATILSILYGAFILSPPETGFLKPTRYGFSTGLLLIGLGLIGILVSNDKIRNNGERFDEYVLTPLQWSKAEYRILLYGAVLSLAPQLILWLFGPTLVPLPSDVTTPVTVAQILATIFAISISLSLLGVEYFSQELTPRVVTIMAESILVRIVLLSYLISIPGLVYADLVFSDMFGVRAALVLLVWNLACLVSYIAYVARRVDPIGQVEAVREQVPADYGDTIVENGPDFAVTIEDDEDRFIDIANITIRAVDEKNLFVFVQWVNLLIEKEREFVQQRREKFEEGIIERDDAIDEIEPIMQYFSFIHSLILSEAVYDSTPRFLRPYTKLYAERIDEIYRIHAWKLIPSQFPSSTVLQEFWEILFTALECDEATGHYTGLVDDHLETTLQAAIEVADYAYQFNEDAPSPDELPPDEEYLFMWSNRCTEVPGRLIGRLISQYRICVEDVDQNLADFLYGRLRTVLEILVNTDGYIEYRKQIAIDTVSNMNDLYLEARETDLRETHIFYDTLLIKACEKDRSIPNDRREVLLAILDEYEQFACEQFAAGDMLLEEKTRLSLVDAKDVNDKVILQRVLKAALNMVESSSADSPATLQTIYLILNENKAVIDDDLVREGKRVLKEYDYDKRVD